MLEALSILAAVVVLALVILEQRQNRGWGMAREQPEPPTFCAWCVYRSGEDCTNPASPVFGQACGPVCYGDLRCKVRKARQ